MPEDQWGSLALTLEAVCLFSCLRRTKGEGLPGPVRWCVARAARLALPMYLVSYTLGAGAHSSSGTGPLCAPQPESASSRAAAKAAQVLFLLTSLSSHLVSLLF